MMIIKGDAIRVVCKCKVIQEFGNRMILGRFGGSPGCGAISILVGGPVMVKGWVENGRLCQLHLNSYLKQSQSSPESNFFSSSSNQTVWIVGPLLA